MSPAVKNILILNVIFFFAQWALPQFMPSLMLFPFGSENFEPWQLATHFFMHGGIGHLFFNMFALVIFGSNLERVWGPKRFLIYYIACAFGAALIHMLVNYLRIQGIEAQLSSAEINQVYNEGFDLLNTGYNYQGIGGELNSLLNTPMLGASGAVFGLLAAFGYLFPNTELMLLFPPIPIKAKFFVIGYAALELYLGFSNNPTDNVAHFAHLGGALVGIIIVLIWQRNKNQFF
jgi:membrane associated rhomboid family serine protease